MRIRSTLLITLLLALHTPALWAGESFLALCYHDVQDKLPADTAIITLSGDELLAQFSWLKAHDYHPVGLDDLNAERLECMVKLDLLGNHALGLGDALCVPVLSNPGDDLAGFVGITCPVNAPARGLHGRFELLQVAVKMGDGMCPDGAG